MTSTPKRPERVVGSLRRTGDGRGAVRVADVYDTDVDDLWSALTEPTRLARWVASVEGDLRVGGQIYARFTSSYEGPGRIDVCEAPLRLVVTWEAGTPGETVTEALLSKVAGGTQLVIEERGVPLDDFIGHGAGWQVHMEDLGSYLAGREHGAWRPRWAELMPTYRLLAADL